MRTTPSPPNPERGDELGDFLPTVGRGGLFGTRLVASRHDLPLAADPGGEAHVVSQARPMSHRLDRARTWHGRAGA